MTRRTTRHLLVTTTLLSALALAPRQAHADESASEHAKKGQVAYDLQDWPTAIKEFDAAYRAEQKPEYLWSLAQAQRLSGKCKEAIGSYKAFQRLDVTANQANTAELMVTKCEAEIAKAEAKAASEPRKAESESGAEPTTTAPAEADTRKSSGGLGIGWFLAGAGLTVALGAAATWSGIDTLNRSSEYEDNPTRQRYLDGKDSEQRTNLLFVATGVAALGTAVIAIFTDWSGEPDTREQRGRVRVRPAVSTNGGGLFLTGAF